MENRLYLTEIVHALVFLAGINSILTESLCENVSGESHCSVMREICDIHFGPHKSNLTVVSNVLPGNEN